MKHKFLILSFLFFTIFWAKGFAQSQQDSVVLRVSVNGVLRPLSNDSLYLAHDEDDVLIELLKKDSFPIYFQWTDIDKKLIVWNLSMIRYTNIKGGDATFTIWRDSLQKVKLAHFYVKSEYAFGEKTWTWYAIGFYFVTIASAIAFFWIIYNNMQRQKMQRVRNQISDDLHDEVGASLSGIGIFAKLLKKKFAKDNPEMQIVIDNIIETSSSSVQNLRDSVWAINPKNDTMEKLFARMCSFAIELLNAKDIEVAFFPTLEEAERLLEKTKVNMEQRRAIYLIFKEIIHNILKHSEATKVQISINTEQFGLGMSIIDNGKGFDSKSEFEGNGMQSLRSRAKAALIDFDLGSTEGKGTTVKLFIPKI